MANDPRRYGTKIVISVGDRVRRVGSYHLGTAVGRSWAWIRWDDGDKTLECPANLHVMPSLDPVMTEKHPAIHLDGDGVPCVRNTPVSEVLRSRADDPTDGSGYVDGDWIDLDDVSAALRFAADELERRHGQR